MVKHVKGSILDTDLDFIAHGVNCQGKMGSGVAKVLFTKYPEVRSDYLRFWNYSFPFVEQTSHFLGKVQPITVDDGKVIFNCFTQEFFGYDGKKYGDYDAIRNCFLTIGESYGNIEVAIPKIGCGLAGLDWSIVENILEEVCKETGLMITVYSL